MMMPWQPTVTPAAPLAHASFHHTPTPNHLILNMINTCQEPPGQRNVGNHQREETLCYPCTRVCDIPFPCFSAINETLVSKQHGNTAQFITSSLRPAAFCCAGAIKTSMLLANADIIRTVGHTLRAVLPFQQSSPPLVLDPVCILMSGHALLKGESTAQPMLFLSHCCESRKCRFIADKDILDREYDACFARAVLTQPASHTCQGQAHGIWPWLAHHRCRECCCCCYCCHYLCIHKITAMCKSLVQHDMNIKILF